MNFDTVGGIEPCIGGAHQLLCIPIPLRKFGRMIEGPPGQKKDEANGNGRRDCYANRNRHVRVQRGTARSFRKMAPSFITKITLCVALILSTGFPGTATTSASIPGFSAPTLSCKPSSSAADVVPAIKDCAVVMPSATINANSSALSPCG